MELDIDNNETLLMYEHEIMELKQALQNDKLEIEYLKTMLSNAKTLIRQMEMEFFKVQEDYCYHKTQPSSDSSSDSSNSLATNSSDGHGRKKHQFSKQVLERWEFYNTHKTDTEIINPLLKKFKGIGIPWHLVKKKTDELFFRNLEMVKE